MTALHIAVKQENVEIVKLLLSNKNLDINAKKVFNTLFPYTIFIYSFK